MRRPWRQPGNRGSRTCPPSRAGLARADPGRPSAAAGPSALRPRTTRSADAPTGPRSDDAAYEHAWRSCERLDPRWGAARWGFIARQSRSGSRPRMPGGHTAGRGGA